MKITAYNKAGMLRQFARILQRVMLRTAMRAASVVAIDGFQIFLPPDVVDGRHVVDRLRTGLDLITQHDLRRYKRMQGDMGKLIVVRGLALEVYSDLRVGTLNEGWILQASAVEIAIMLIEMSARARMGSVVSSLGSQHRERVWRRSTLEQLSFASKLSSSDSAELRHLLSHLKQKLRRYAESS